MAAGRKPKGKKLEIKSGDERPIRPAPGIEPILVTVDTMMGLRLTARTATGGSRLPSSGRLQEFKEGHRQPEAYRPRWLPSEQLAAPRLRFDIDGTARCCSCNTKFVYANDAKAGETHGADLFRPGRHGNIARAPVATAKADPRRGDGKAVKWPIREGTGWGADISARHETVRALRAGFVLEPRRGFERNPDEIESEFLGPTPWG